LRRSGCTLQRTVHVGGTEVTNLYGGRRWMATPHDTIETSRKEEHSEMNDQIDKQEQVMGDVLDEVLSEDEDDDNDPVGARPVERQIHELVAEGQGLQQEQEPIGVFIPQAMDVDAHAPPNPVGGQQNGQNIENEPPIEGYAR
jgi:hypothetical protein